MFRLIRPLLCVVICFGLGSPSSAAPRKDATPLAKAPSTVAPCLGVCEEKFKACEAEPQSTDTLKGLKRSPEELRYKPLDPQSPLERCRQACQDRRALCLGNNQRDSCDGATTACYARCEAPPAKGGKKSAN